MESSIPNPDNMSSNINVKIRSMDKEFMVEINTHEKIENLKHKIETITKVPINRQRLIFRGKLLKNEETITVCKITNEDVVHLVAKIGEINNNNDNEQEETHQNNSASHRSSGRNSLFGFMNQFTFERGINSRFSSFFPQLSSLRRFRRNENNNRQPIINLVEAKETIEQNIQGINNMITCGNYNNKNESLNFDKKINCFDFNKRNLIKGQWVDVKDTVDQWLEAQVINVKEDKSQVYIHYNGWETRWDEWINMNSPRIMPFRFHTKQRSFHNYNSPFPNSKPDSNVMLSSNSQNNTDNNNMILDNVNKKGFLEDLNEAKNLNNFSVDLINKITSLSFNFSNNNDSQNSDEKKNKTQLEVFYNIKQLIPLLDKIGRLYCDMGSYLNSAIRSNKLKEINNAIFNDANTKNDMLKPFSDEEQKKINDELLSHYGDRENRSGTVNFIPPMNKFETNLVNQIPIIDTPLAISDRNSNQPDINIYVHTFASQSDIDEIRNEENNPNAPNNSNNNTNNNNNNNNNNSNNNNSNNNVSNDTDINNTNVGINNNIILNNNNININNNVLNQNHRSFTNKEHNNNFNNTSSKQNNNNDEVIPKTEDIDINKKDGDSLLGKKRNIDDDNKQENDSSFKKGDTLPDNKNDKSKKRKK